MANGLRSGAQWECRFMSTPAKPFGASRGDGDLSPYAPKRSRSTGSDSQHGLDDPPPPRFLVSSRDGEREPDLTDFNDSSLQFRESPLSQSTTRRSPFSERRSYSASDHARGDSTDDIDLQRLEESVRRLQREAAVSTRARPFDEPAGGQAGDARVQRRRADTYIDGYRVPPSLQPEVLTPPSELREGHGRLWTVMSMLIASAVAAPIAYYFAAGSSSSDPKIASAESRPTVETLTVTAPTVPARPSRSQERVDVAAVPEASTVVPRRTSPAPEPQRVERTPPAPPPQRATPPAPAQQNVERTPPAPPPPAQRVT